MDPAWLAAIVELVAGPSYCAGVAVEPGLVVTAYHCVASGMRPAVRTKDGRQAIGRVVGVDPANDLALVTVEGLDLPILPVREEPPVVGETVWALGHPFVTASTGRLEGLLAWSASRGVVSAANAWFVQTDAPVNPGNSGGPLLDAEGRILGIGSRKIPGDGVAFYSRASAIAPLRADRPRMSPLGGSWGLGVGIVQDTRTAPIAEAWVSFRERVVLRAQAGVALGDEPDAALIGTAALRQRLGRGTFSTTIEAGGGVRYDGDVAPVVTGRIGLRRIGFGAMVDPLTRDWAVVIDVEWPGTVAVF